MRTVRFKVTTAVICQYLYACCIQFSQQTANVSSCWMYLKFLDKFSIELTTPKPGKIFIPTTVDKEFLWFSPKSFDSGFLGFMCVDA